MVNHNNSESIYMYITIKVKAYTHLKLNSMHTSQTGTYIITNAQYRTKRYILYSTKVAL